MKKPVLILTVIGLAMILFNSCKPDLPNFPPDATLGGSYQPVSKGTAWRYQEDDSGNLDTLTTRITGNTSPYNGKTYYEAENDAGVYGKDTSYYYRGNNIYSIRSQEFAPNTAFEYIYLKDAAVGTTWNDQFSDNSTGVNVTGQMTGKVVERNISKTVLGKTYTNVIHSNVTMTLTIPGLGTSTSTTDFYIAKNIGMVQIESSDGSSVSINRLIDYTIK